MKRNDNDKLYAIIYSVFGLILLALIGLDYHWQIFLAFGLGVLALIEYTGGEDKDRNYVFMAIFLLLAIGIVFAGATYEYWLLCLTFLFWGVYEYIEERKIDSTKKDMVGILSIIVGLLFIATGLAGNPYPEYLGIAFAIMSTTQGIKEFYD